METKSKRIVNGKTSTDLIFWANVGLNEDIFPQILDLFVPDGAEIADVTDIREEIFLKKG